MEIRFLNNPRRNAFIPPALLLLCFPYLKLLNIFKITPGYYWIYEWGIQIYFLGLWSFMLIFPLINLCYFDTVEHPSKLKHDIFFMIISFLPFFYVVTIFAL
jgi:hypothetical protein